RATRLPEVIRPPRREGTPRSGIAELTHHPCDQIPAVSVHCSAPTPPELADGTDRSRLARGCRLTEDDARRVSDCRARATRPAHPRLYRLAPSWRGSAACETRTRRDEVPVRAATVVRQLAPPP